MYIIYKKKFIKIGQIWFQNNLDTAGIDQKIDIAFFHGIEKRQDGKCMLSQEFHTLISDLTETEDDIYSKINKNVKYEIRKNRTEEVDIRAYKGQEILQNKAVLRDLGGMYQVMYKSKGIDSKFNFTQAELYAKEGALLITGIYKEGKPLVLHSYLFDDRQARLLHSVSDFRDMELDANLIARSNKRLHWEDLQLLKNMGIRVCDWGGISSFEKPNGIDTFKMKFGGNPLTYYNIFVGKSLMGKLGIKVLKMKQER